MQREKTKTYAPRNLESGFSEEETILDVNNGNVGSDPENESDDEDNSLNGEENLTNDLESYASESESGEESSEISSTSNSNWSDLISTSTNNSKTEDDDLDGEDNSSDADVEDIDGDVSVHNDSSSETENFEDEKNVSGVDSDKENPDDEDNAEENSATGSINAQPVSEDEESLPPTNRFKAYTSDLSHMRPTPMRPSQSSLIANTISTTAAQQQTTTTTRSLLSYNMHIAKRRKGYESDDSVVTALSDDRAIDAATASGHDFKLRILQS